MLGPSEARMGERLRVWTTIRPQKPRLTLRRSFRSGSVDAAVEFVLSKRNERGR
jgi:hypothetical protein